MTVGARPDPTARSRPDASRATASAPSVRQMVAGNRSAGLECARYKQEYGLDVQHTSNTHPTYVQRTSNIASNIVQFLYVSHRPGYVLRLRWLGLAFIKQHLLFYKGEGAVWLL